MIKQFKMALLMALASPILVFAGDVGMREQREQ